MAEKKIKLFDRAFLNPVMPKLIYCFAAFCIIYPIYTFTSKLVEGALLLSAPLFFLFLIGLMMIGVGKKFNKLVKKAKRIDQIDG